MSRIMNSALLCLSLFAISQSTLAQDYPTKPIRIVNAYAAGGPNDLTLRPITQYLSGVFGHQVIVENKAGANGNIGADFVAKSAPDGYTMLFASTSQLTVNPALYKMPFDAIRDFAPVGQVTMNPSVIVLHAALPIPTAKELIAYAKANPGKLSYASAGIGSVNHLGGELLAMITKTPMLHVPFSGSGPALSDVVAGRVDMMIISPATTLPFIKAGKLRMVLVSSNKRLSFAPDVPTMIEAGLPDFVSQSGTGLLAPAKTPRSVITRINAEVVKYLNSSEGSTQLGNLGLQVVPGTPEDFAQLLREETTRWAAVVKAANIKLE